MLQHRYSSETDCRSLQAAEYCGALRSTGGSIISSLRRSFMFLHGAAWAGCPYLHICSWRCLALGAASWDEPRLSRARSRTQLDQTSFGSEHSDLSHLTSPPFSTGMGLTLLGDQQKTKTDAADSSPCRCSEPVGSTNLPMPPHCNSVASLKDFVIPSSF